MIRATEGGFSIKTKVKRMARLLVLLLIASVNYVCIQGEVYTQPEQVHLSYGDNPSEMVVTWVTFTSTNGSIVEYGVDNLSRYAKGVEELFLDGGSEHRKIYMHRVKLAPLVPGQKYIYHVGSALGWSSIFFFTAMKSGSDWGPRFAFFGDMGNKNAKSLGRIQEEVQHNHFDALLHVGDFAYDMNSDNARVGDAFMNQIQSIAAYLPYMTCVGNHESPYNFSNYKSRFTMPVAKGDGHNLWYSFDIGPVHVIAFTSEVFYYVQYGFELIAQQYKWLIEDLEEANKPGNRAQRPWIISMTHRPMYCSNSNDKEHCPNPENLARVGLPLNGLYGTEDLLYKYGVDVHLTAHLHSYERMWPVYNMTVCNGTDPNNPYKNPRAPVHVVSGSAGCQEGTAPFLRHLFPWSAHHSDDYGYTRMTVHNRTHLSMQQVSDDQDGKVIDEMLIVKDKHGAGLYDCHRDQHPPAGKLTDYPKVWVY